MLYFLEKAGKITKELGALPPTPRWTPAAAPPLDPKLLFLALRRFLDIVKTNITTYYLILE